jgi:lambda family phage portal protein
MVTIKKGYKKAYGGPAPNRQSLRRAWDGFSEGDPPSPPSQRRSNSYAALIGQIGPSNRLGYGNYGASRNKIALEGWLAASGSADQDIVYNLPLLRQRSRDLFMGAPIAGAAVLTLRTNTIGSGLVPMPQIDYEVLGMGSDEANDMNKFISDEFDLFADTVECDWDRRSTFYQLEDLVLVNAIISGDILATLPMKERRGGVYDTKVRLIEADRVCNPILYEEVSQQYTDRGVRKVFGGVELSDDDEVDAYWVAKVHPDTRGYVISPPPQSDLSIEDLFVRLPAFGQETGRPLALLVSDMERPEQRRGVPMMAKCLTEMKQLQRYIESTTLQNVIKSYFTAFVTSEMPSTDMFDGIVDQEFMEDLIKRDPYQVRLAPGVVNWMRPGDSVTFPINAGPEKEFEPYVIALVKFIGACLGIPYEVLLKQFNSSYSASRASILEFWRTVKKLRQQMIDQFCQPVYETWMMEAIAKGIWRAPNFFTNPRIHRAWTRCAWSGSSQGSIDPLKEILASEKKIKLGVSTLERECLEINGSDWRANTIQQSLEAEFAKEKGLPYSRLQTVRDDPIPQAMLEDDAPPLGRTP